MKRAFAIIAALVVFVALAFSFGTVKANPPRALLPQLTTTATPTIDPCALAPVKPKLVAPGKGQTIQASAVTLRWKQVDCVKRYRLVVRKNSATGPVVWGGNVKDASKVLVLPRGAWYYWKVRACTPVSCAWSKERSFYWKQGNPVPTKTPTPIAGQPTATPVAAGTPPPQIANYQGDGAYLHDNPNELWRFDCAKDKDKWIGYLVGKNIYNIALWYTPNEPLQYQRMDFNLATVVESATLSANSSGYIALTVNTASWTPDHHYHLIFKGKQSGAQHCGHFDVRTANAAAGADTLDHSPDAVERVYRQAGVELK